MSLPPDQCEENVMSDKLGLTHMNSVGLRAPAEHLLQETAGKLLLLNKLLPDVDFNKHFAVPLP